MTGASNGIQAEAADAFFANYFETSKLPTATLSLSPVKPKAKK